MLQLRPFHHPNGQMELVLLSMLMLSMNCLIVLVPPLESVQIAIKVVKRTLLLSKIYFSKILSFCFENTISIVIDINTNYAGNTAQKEATISFSESPKFNPDARPFYPPTNNISPPASISTDESSSLSSQNSGEFHIQSKDTNVLFLKLSFKSLLYNMLYIIFR